MPAGSNSIEFRIVQTVSEQTGQVIGERWQVRTKDVTASVLGLIPLASSWSPWQEINVTVVTETS